MSRFVLLVSLLLAAFSGCGAQELSPYLCDVNLTVRAPANVPVDLPWAIFTGTAGDSLGKLEIVNKTDKTIQYFLIVMEFVDDKGEYLFSVPVFNVDKDQKIPFNVPFKSWLVANGAGGHKDLISPNSDHGATFNAPLVALTCPASVRISMVQLKYLDQSSFEYVSPIMNLSTAPSKPIEIADRKAAQRWAPLTVSGTIEVDAQSHLRVLNLDFNAVGFSKWLEKELVGWRFTAPWIGGKPASVQIPFVLILADTTDPRVEIEAIKRRGVGGTMLLLYFGRSSPGEGKDLRPIRGRRRLAAAPH